MKKLMSPSIFLLLSFLLLVVAGGCSGSQPTETYSLAKKQKLTIGSTGANLPILSKLADSYSEKNKNVIIEIPVSLNNEEVVTNIEEGNIDIGLTSIPLQSNKKNYLQQNVFARTIVVIAVNPSVSISGLSKQQLLGIYSGKITNWRELGGNDSKIMVLSTVRGKSTMAVIDNYVKGFKDLTLPSDTIMLKDYQTMNEGIVSIRDSIGLSDIGTIKADELKVKTLAIEGVLPTVENYNSGQYYIAKDLYMLTSKNPSNLAQDFVSFVLGWEGKKVIMDNGFLIPNER